MKIVIVTYPIFDLDNQRFSIGGVQTYVKDLCALAQSLKYEVTICQIENKQPQIDKISIRGLEIRTYYSKSFFSNRFQRGFNKIYSDYKRDASLFIIVTDQLGIRCPHLKNVIVIQHGINFDRPGNYLPSLFGKIRLLWKPYKIALSLRSASRFHNTQNTVCVDFNYVNWFRTLDTIPTNHKVNIILNYASSCISEGEMLSKLNRSREHYKIVFARRFTNYRGTLLFANVVRRLFLKYENLDVTFAGEGPLKETIKKMFQGDERVHFANYSASESVQFHKQYDIAVVPTIFSEGSSLSLCEAMSAGCFPVVSMVGGMSNMIINRYNGVLFYPNEENLYNSLEKAINLPKDEFNKIVYRAYETSIDAFSIQRWQREWTEVLDKFKK